MTPGRALGKCSVSYSPTFVLLELSLTLVIASPGFGERNEKAPSPGLAVARSSSGIVLDGRLSEPAWANATVVELPFEWFPGENAAPPVRTECFVTHDDTHLYVGFVAHDSAPGQIRAHLMDRDQIETMEQDDHVEFFLDTFGDGRRAYQFRVNPLGVQADALNTVAGEDWDWDAIWTSAGRLTQTGYSVEASVPFRELSLPSTERDISLGFNAVRSWPRDTLHRIQSFRLDYGDSCRICQFPQISGFKGVATGPSLELNPTSTATRIDGEREDIGQSESALDVEPGLTVRGGLGSNLAFAGTVNPDFSQVEADGAQLEVNRRFAVFYPEKRPFFLEGKDAFQTPMQAIFSRTVVNPSLGTKLTGKIGENALGAFVTHDRVNNLVIPTSQFSSLDSVTQDVTGTVIRYRRDIGRSSNLGGVYAGRESQGYHNRVFGIDGLVQLASADTLEFQLLHSDTLYPFEVAERQLQNQAPFRGTGLTLNYTHVSRDWNWFAQYEFLAPGFRADSGFIPRVDSELARAWVARTWWGDSESWWTSFEISPAFFRRENVDGQLIYGGIGLDCRFQGPLQSDLIVSVTSSKEVFDAVPYRLHQAHIDFAIQPAASMKFSVVADVGDEIDALNSQEGDLLSLRPHVELKLGRRLNVTLAQYYQQLDVEGERVFRELISEARIFYQVNLRSLIRLIFQYRGIDLGSTLPPTGIGQESSQLYAQVLASYKLNARTAVFVGYSDDRVTSIDASMADRRTIFLKVSYAWNVDF